jgi:hypothetical protein
MSANRPPGAPAKRVGFGAAILAIRRQQAQPFRMPDHPGQDKKTQRRSAALRENLRRRKAQAKGRNQGRQDGHQEGPRAAGTAQADAGRPHDSAGIADEK